MFVCFVRATWGRVERVRVLRVFSRMTSCQSKANQELYWAAAGINQVNRLYRRASRPTHTATTVNMLERGIWGKKTMKESDPSMV